MLNKVYLRALSYIVVVRYNTYTHSCLHEHTKAGYISPTPPFLSSYRKNHQFLLVY